jgi:hypothetical protein
MSTALPRAHLALLFPLVLSTACASIVGKLQGEDAAGENGGSGGDGASADGSADEGGEDDPTEGQADPPDDGLCGRSTASHFYVARLELLIDPLDFADESWDWDGGGIEEFWDEYSWLIEFFATYTGYGDAYEVVDLLVPIADAAAPILASPYVSPDPMAVWWHLDRAGEWWELDEIWHDDDQNLLQYRDLELTFNNGDEALVVDVYDRDLAFDDYAGWDYLDREFVRSVADCGPFVYVYTDRQMADLDSRVRAIGIEVESW